MISLTDTEAIALLAYVRKGSAKEAGRFLGRSESHIRKHLQTARDRNDCPTTANLAYRAFAQLQPGWIIER